MSALESSPPRSFALSLLRIVAFAAIAALFTASYIFGWKQHVSVETLLTHRSTIDNFVSAHPLTALLAFVSLYAAMTAGAIPAGAVLAIIGGLIFGLSIGTLGATIGSTCGATLLFLLVRGLAMGRLPTGPLTATLATGFRADAFYYILFLRLVPSPSWLTSAASGALGVPVAVFMTATALGRIPGSLVFANFGAGLAQILSSHEAVYKACIAVGGTDCRMHIGPATVLTPTVVASLIGLAVLALVPVLAKRFLRPRIAASRAAEGQGS
jgi:uncharacterized membrane protein YdjX (TVP38/TMEM64 family)